MLMILIALISLYFYKKGTLSDKNKLLDAENLIATLKTKITSLENYIKANLP